MLCVGLFGSGFAGLGSSANMSALGTPDNPLQVAIVGSGPSAFYAAEALLKCALTVRISVIERLPAPFGLVRNGVAPDHPKLKQPIQVYDKIAGAPELSFFGNVTVGRDLSAAELASTHHAVIFACGAESDRRLGIRGEELAGSHTATEFVGWYNGHPDYRDRVFDLSCETALIIGQGNVATDVARMLAKTVDELEHTDIAEHALDALGESRVREIHIVGRRGPAQAKFTGKELKELGELQNCDAIVNPADLVLNSESETEIADKNNLAAAKNVQIFRDFAARAPAGKPRRLCFHFLKSPVELQGTERLGRVVFETNRLEGPAFRQKARSTGKRIEFSCGLLFRSIGYQGVPLPGVPFDAGRGVFPNCEGRILADSETVRPGLYATGWIKRGPTGIIGTNRADSVATVNSLLADLNKLDAGAKPGAVALRSLLAARGTRAVSYSNWQAIDAAEVSRGAPKGKPREKFTRVAEMLAAIPSSQCNHAAEFDRPARE
jgi:ferredoxin--NADP+ reductase